MLIGFNSLIAILLISAFLQNVTLVTQTLLMKNQTSLRWWVLSSISVTVGYVILSESIYGVTNPWFLFAAMIAFLGSDILRLYGVQKEFSTNSTHNLLFTVPDVVPYYFVLIFLYVGVLGASFYIYQEYQLTSILLFVFRMISSLFGIWLLSRYKNVGLKFSRYLLFMVYVVMVIVDFINFRRLQDMRFISTIFGSQEVLVYSFELIKSYIWTLGILTLNINQVEIVKEENQLKYETVFNVNPDVQFILKDRNHEVIEVNDSFIKSTGVKRQDVIGKKLGDIGVLFGMRNLHEQYHVWKNSTTQSNIEIRGTLMSGTKFIGLLGIRRIEVGGHDVLINSVRNVSEIKQFQRINTILSDVIMQNPIAVCVTDTNGTITFVNDQFTKLTGYAGEEVVGKTPRILKSGRYDNDFYKKLWDTILGGYEWNSEMLNRHKNGTFYWEINRIVPVKDDDGEIIAFLSMKDDITNMKLNEQTLQQKARLDGLTGLYNYGYFIERFQSILNSKWEPDQQNAFMMLDIDDFKQINDTHGHPFADRVLQHLSRNLYDTLRKNDIIGRLGGEEFGVVITDTDAEKAYLAAERLRKEVEETEFYTDYGKRVSVTISIGVTLFNVDSNIDEILRVADEAMYQSKNSGKNYVTLVR